ncbi:MAG: bifunctional riboflavin kinase/FMN adenylyltransferase [Phycisphaerales bacterium]|nr:bifunctional riboflavin kinase/FMN adenylyltransferase [Phycisphaerales bacterium]
MRPVSTVVTVGNFDGVHAGHAAIVRRARALAAPNGGSVVVLAFDPHPLSRLAPERAPQPLTTFPERAELLRQAGADIVERLEPTEALLRLSPEAFVEWVVERHNPGVWIEGQDFRFGHGRAGSVETLQQLGGPLGFTVELAPTVSVALSDHTVVPASSSLTRWMLSHGRARDAWSMLGRPYRLGGQVVRGDRRGRTLGFPTANFESPTILPADGVYAAVATLPGGARHPAALSVGSKPQFGGLTRTAEAFILDAPTDPGTAHLPGLTEYGWQLALDVVGWIRDQMRFDSIERLVAQMERDCARVRGTVHSLTIPTPAHAAP